MAERIRAIITGYDLQAQGEVHREARSGEQTDYPVIPPEVKDAAYRAPLMLFLEAFVKTHSLGRVLADGTGFRPDGPSPDNPPFFPDIALVSFERLPADAYLDRLLDVAPDLAVEPVWPTDSPEVVLERVTDWLGQGVAQLWLVAPGPREILVFSPADRDGARLTIEDDLIGQGVLAGFTIPLRALFDADKALQVEVLRKLLIP